MTAMMPMKKIGAGMSPPRSSRRSVRAPGVPPWASATSMASTPASIPSRNRSSLRRGPILPADDVVALKIGERAANPFAGLDAHPSFAGHDDQEHAIVELFLPDLPLIEGVVGDILDGLTPRVAGDEDDDLGARSLAESVRASSRALRDRPGTSAPRCRSLDLRVAAG